MINDIEVKKAMNGDIYAFQNLIEDLKVYMYSIAIRYLKNEDDAGDAIGNTVILAYENIKSLRKTKYFKTWITKILINECNKILKTRKKVILLDDYDHIEESYKEEIEKDIDIKDYINKLPNIQKSVILMYFYEEMTIEEIANTLQIAVGTVKSRLFNAKKSFRNIIKMKGGIIE